MFHFCSYCKIFTKYLKEDAMASILTSARPKFPLTQLRLSRAAASQSLRNPLPLKKGERGSSWMPVSSTGMTTCGLRPLTGAAFWFEGELCSFCTTFSVRYLPNG